ncbi:MAG: protein kinase, partial [Pseudomonadota bacterium]
MDTAIPREFDGYRLVKPIGKGAMGVVYLGYDTLIERPVAIKFISAASADPETKRRFLVEARAAARLQHPCIVTIYRAGEIAGHPYTVSEFLEGRGLDSLELPVAWNRALEIGYDLARGLAVAHRSGVIHRDIKPGNVFLTNEGTLKILDIGIAVLLEEAALRDAPPALLGAGGGAKAPHYEGAAAEHKAPHHEGRETENDATAVVDGPPELHDGLSDVEIHRKIIAGTPAYMPPEAWQANPATFASDVYSLGVLLYKLCSGRTPHVNANVQELRRQVLGHDAPPLQEAAANVDASFAAVVDKCIRRDPLERFQSGEEVRAALSRLIYRSRTDVLPEGNPYRGLRPFEAEHQSFFFGRDSEVRTILERFSADPIVVVAGDSGVGKSSLCRSGILSRVQEWLDKKRTWLTAVIVPGRDPLAAFSASVAGPLGIGEQEVESMLAEGPDVLRRELCRALGHDRGLVLFFDQLEELVTQCEEEKAAAMAELFGRLAMPAPGLKVLATIRGDFLSRLAAFPAIGDAIERCLYFLRPLSRDRVREAVQGPARVKGFCFETDELVDELVESTVNARGGLPLLQFGLEKLWEQRDEEKKVIPGAALEALGGVAGALSLHADEVLGGLRAGRQEAARFIFMRLVSADGTRVARTHEELESIHPEAGAALDALVKGRLVVARDAPGGAVCEIAHEALVHGWKTLAGWLASDVEAHIVRERLEAASAEWERLGRPREALWGAKQVAEVRGLRETGAELSEMEREFLEQSRRVIRRKRIFGWGLAVMIPLVIALIYGGIRLKTAMEVREKVLAGVGECRGRLANADALKERMDANEKLAFSLFDGGELDKAEETWVKAGEAEAKLQHTLGVAGREVELALMLDAGHGEARSLLADVLFQRALLAEKRRDGAAVDELLMRLKLYDEGGGRMQKWGEPGRLTARISPAADVVVLERYRASEDGRLKPEVVDNLKIPIENLILEPGSYRLTLGADGMAEVRCPFTIGRGESLDIHIAMPPSGAVPPGFAYVPAGRFYFGTARDDSIRRGFMHTVPIHAVETGAYLMAKHETTFRQWIEFIESLPVDQRASRLPTVHVGGFEGALGLELLPDGRWQLTIKPTVQSYTAVAGEKLIYSGREKHAQQDWLSFPVAGITADDARAYAQWLDETGRVQGARLCTELEWERAAGGADERPWPHGFALAPDEANFDMTYGKIPAAMGPDEVGSHPESRSPFDVDDLAGNVWEWTVNVLGDGDHAARGGSFYFDLNSARKANREV